MKNKLETIRKTMSFINDYNADGGGFWLPNIQRPFVWSEEQITRLFDSIMRQYPIGTFLVWKSDSSIKTRRFIDTFQTDIKLSHYTVPVNTKNKTLVLDGQQRIQSLYIGLMGSYEKKELYFNILSGDVSAPDDIRFEFKFLASKQVKWPWIRFKDIIFNNNQNRKIASSIISSSKVTLNEEEIDRIEENVERAKQEFLTDLNIGFQELDSMEYPEDYQENDIVEIFIRANAGGTKLGKSDLLFSLLSSSWDEVDIEMERLLDDLNKTGYAFNQDFILKTFLTLLNKGARYEISKFRDSSVKQEIISRWKEITDSIKDVRDFIYGKTFIRNDKALLSYLVLIPLIYFRYYYHDKWKKTKGIDEYLMRTLIGGAFSGSPDNLIDQCINTIKSDRDFIVKNIFNTIRENGRNLDISDNTLLTASYGSKQIHLFFNIWYKNFDYTPAFINNQPQIDHIFPQSVLKQIKEVNPETGKMNIAKYKSDARNQIANCMLLSAVENGAGGKSDILPSVWFRESVIHFGEKYLDMHLIPKDEKLWELDRFDDFIEERKKLIIEKFNFMLLK